LKQHRAFDNPDYVNRRDCEGARSRKEDKNTNPGTILRNKNIYLEFRTPEAGRGDIEKMDSKLKDGSKKILVVDDDDLLLDAVSQMLFRLGFHVIAANSGDKGLDLFLKRKCDIVLTDFDMPGLDGISLASHVKEKSPDTVVILMTGHDRESVMDQVSDSPVDLTLFKPFDLWTLVQTLQQPQPQRATKQMSCC
jgi:CheY-like chemotaxis protein